MSEKSVLPLLEWAQLNGAAVNESIAFKKDAKKGLHGVVEGHIDPSKPNIAIPIDLTLNPKQALEFFGVGEFKNALDINSVTKHFLNYQRHLKDQSFWHPYISLLPEGQEIDSPLYWTKSERHYLKGTNLGSSLKDHFETVIEEWFDSLKYIPEKFKHNDQFKENLKLYSLYKSGKLFDNDSELQKLINEYDVSNWLSFPCYLWSSVIFKSRSFPYILVDEDSDPRYSMLLPVVDLLNHDPDSFVSWSMDDGKKNFFMNNNMSSVLKKGDELFNNYGGKGNEELLLGYGFVIEGNKRDSVALRIKVPVENLPLVESFGIRLPKLEDYTTSVYSLKPLKKVTDYKEYEKGLLYYCNNEELLPTNLVNLFAFLVKNTIEGMMSLRMRLDGLAHLRSALELKLTAIKNSGIIKDTNERLRKAQIYKEGQQALLTKMVTELKEQEKRILKDQKSRLWDLKKILKKDKLFANSLLLTFGLRGAEDIEENGVEDQVLILWLIRCYNRGPDDEVLPAWIQTLFAEFLAKVPVTQDDKLAFKALHEYFFPALSTKIPEVYAEGNWGLKEMVVSGKLIQFISYSKGSKKSLVLVEPVAIAV